MDVEAVSMDVHRQFQQQGGYLKLGTQRGRGRVIARREIPAGTAAETIAAEIEALITLAEEHADTDPGIAAILTGERSPCVGPYPLHMTARPPPSAASAGATPGADRALASEVMAAAITMVKAHGAMVPSLIEGLIAAIQDGAEARAQVSRLAAMVEQLADDRETEAGGGLPPEIQEAAAATVAEVIRRAAGALDPLAALREALARDPSAASEVLREVEQALQRAAGAAAEGSGEDPAASAST